MSLSLSLFCRRCSCAVLPSLLSTLWRPQGSQMPSAVGKCFWFTPRQLSSPAHKSLVRAANAISTTRRSPFSLPSSSSQSLFQFPPSVDPISFCSVLLLLLLLGLALLPSVVNCLRNNSLCIWSACHLIWVDPTPLPSPSLSSHLAMRAICLQTNCPRWKSITPGSCLRVLYSNEIVYLRYFYGLAAVDSNLFASPQRSSQEQKQSCCLLCASESLAVDKHAKCNGK